MRKKSNIKFIRLTISIPEDLYKLIKYDADYEETSLNYLIIKALKKIYKTKQIKED